MSHKDPLLWASLRLSRIYQSWEGGSDDHQLTSAMNSITHQSRGIHRCWNRLIHARQRDWFHAAAHLREDLLSNLHGMAQSCQEALKPGPLPPRYTCPSVPDLLAELRQLEDEFGSIRVERQAAALTVCLDPITLEEINLGSFSIALRMNDLCTRRGASCFEIIAEEPNPASSDGATIHPHVRDGALCAGDATTPIAQALSSGRLADAFCLVRSVLQTYNSQSPYVSLSDWYGTECEECSTCMDPQEQHSCEQCHGEVCDECIGSCEECGRSLCRNCLTEDQESNFLCSRCGGRCKACDEFAPNRVLSEQLGLCVSCFEEQQSPPQLQETEISRDSEQDRNIHPSAA